MPVVTFTFVKVCSDQKDILFGQKHDNFNKNYIE